MTKCVSCKQEKAPEAFFDDDKGIDWATCRDCIDIFREREMPKTTVYKRHVLNNDIHYDGDSLRSEVYDELSKDDFDLLFEKIKQAGQSTNPDVYEKQLLLLITSHNKVFITTELYRRDQKKSIGLFPDSPMQRRVYNETVEKILRTANEHDERYSNYKNCFFTFEELKKKFEERILDTGSLKDEIVRSEIFMIEEMFPVDQKIKSQDVYDFNDKKDTQTAARKANKRIVAGELFNRLLVNRQFSFDQQFIHWWHHVLIIRCREIVKYYEYLKGLKNTTDKKSNKKTFLPGKNKTKPEHLIDIWDKSQKDKLNKVIDFLKLESATIGHSFVFEKESKLYWREINNHVTFLAAFTKTCIDRGYIQLGHSAPTYQYIYFNTFNIKFNEGPFKPAALAKDLSEYMDVFANMP